MNENGAANVTGSTSAFAELVNGMRLHYVCSTPGPSPATRVFSGSGVSSGAGLSSGTGASTGDAPLMLFVHGFPEFWYAWSAQLAFFSATHRAVAFDMRGYNLSSKPPDVEAYRAGRLVEDLRLLIDHLGGAPCVLVAHDWGGAVAWAFAAAHPEYVRKLVIINAPHPTLFARELSHNPAQQTASAYMNLFRSTKAERVLSDNNFKRLQRMTLDTWAANGGAVSDADRAAYYAAWAQAGALTGGLNYYRASRLHPPEPGDPAAAIELKPCNVDVPTLVIWGVRDEALLLGNLDGLDDHVVNLTVERIPDASHWVVHERPDVVNALIASFDRA
ncbi:MAG: alpha/beta hydrolase [Betaproteobacteria bacterium]